MSRWGVTAGGRAVARCAWRDASTLLTAGADGQALLWDARAGGGSAPALRLHAASAPLRLAAWRPGGGAQLAVAESDAVSALILDVRSGGRDAPDRHNVLAELALEQGALNALAWSPQGGHLAGGATDGQMLVWPAPPVGAAAESAPVAPQWGFAAAAEINALAWAGPHPGAVAIAHGSSLQILTV